MIEFMNKHGLGNKDDNTMNHSKITNKTIPQNATYKKKSNVTKNNKSTALQSFLDNLNQNQLKQLCRLFGTSPNGTKDKLITKIINNDITLEEIDTKINKGKDKRYMRMCGGEFDSDTSDGCLIQHIYFTNTKHFTNELKCYKCKLDNYMDEYDNHFYNKVITGLPSNTNLN